MPVALTATQQDSWPPRVALAVTGLTIGDVVTLYRVVGGVRTPVRGASDVEATDTSLVRLDAEQPFGTPVSYTALVNDEDEYSDGPDTYTLTGGKVAVTDAINGLAAEVIIASWDERVRERASTTYQVGGRNIVVSGPLSPTTQAIELLTEADSSRENLDALLVGATSGVVQIRQPGGYADVDGYYAITSASRRRYMQEGTDQRRVWTLQAVEVDPWAPDLEARGYSYQDVADAYDGLTYDDLAGDYATYLDLAQGVFG